MRSSVPLHFANMLRKVYSIITLAILLIINVKSERNSENKCVDYYQTGNVFDLNSLAGKWYAVYLWPPSPRQRDSCEIITFKKLSQPEVDNAINCEILHVIGETVVQATYKNTAKQLTSIMYYGEEEVKNLFRSCERVQKYIFLQINADYVMGINCSSGGRGILLAKFLPTASQVQALVNSIEIMSGRDGSPDCKLS